MPRPILPSEAASDQRLPKHPHLIGYEIKVARGDRTAGVKLDSRASDEYRPFDALGRHIVARLGKQR